LIERRERPCRDDISGRRQFHIFDAGGVDDHRHPRLANGFTQKRSLFGVALNQVHARTFEAGERAADNKTWKACAGTEVHPHARTRRRQRQQLK
jgi:hypothetical protein